MASSSKSFKNVNNQKFKIGLKKNNTKRVIHGFPPEEVATSGFVGSHAVQPLHE